jgi:Xaa-Pro aminopeptidase
MNLKEFRLGRLAQFALEEDVDLAVASLPQNILYMTGYKSVGQDVLHRTQAYAAYEPKTGRTMFVMSIAEAPSIVETVGADAELFPFGGFRFSGVAGDTLNDIIEKHKKNLYASPEEALAAAIDSSGARRVAIDESRISVTSWGKILAICPKTNIAPGSELFMQARLVKHPDEIAGLETSAEIAEQSLLAALADFRPGMTELDIERMYKTEVVRRGADNFFFVSTAAKRAAYSDTQNTGLVIQKGDMIRFDYGCIYNGYTSDIARTAVVGEGDKKTRAYYEAVRRGTGAAIAMIKPGVVAEEVFNVAMAQTKANGLPHYERHHCGHGIGLEVYDLPSIAPGCDIRLQKDMTLCIETPYYELGWGGVQIEHTVHVTEEGCRYLDKTGDELIVLAV